MKPVKKPRTPTSDKAFPIVAIGASAGGLHALECFLSAVPKHFSFALVFMQHLSATHKSLLPDLIRSRHPHIVVEEIISGLKVKPGKLYLCPPAKELGIQNGLFTVKRLPKDRLHLPIDELFISLADDVEDRAVGVIFSGAGTDGARGVQAVRAMGGTVFVQDPATAEFTGMPQAAINTGQADAVLSPEEIARELLKVSGTEAPPASNENFITPTEFKTVHQLVQQKTGNRFNHYKMSVVSRRINRRMHLQGIASVQDYARFLAEKDAEAGMLATDLMIGVTSFFRDRAAWKALTLEVVRKLVAENSESAIRVWTPACSTGEEPYSIAMLLLHECSLAGKEPDVQVFATDVNDRALEKAREGVYPASIAADLPAEYFQKYFTPAEDGLSVVINKEVRERVVFAKQDLLNDPPFSKLDLIICRNLLIYLEPAAQDKCISLFHYALKQNGALFLGNAESLGSCKALFKSVSHKKCRIYRKVESKQTMRLALNLPHLPERPIALSGKHLPVAEARQAIAELVQESLLEEFTPIAIAINQQYDILYHNGPTNRYLRQPRGIPTQNLLELFPEALRNKIRGGIYRAATESKPISMQVPLTAADKRKKQVLLRFSKVRENLFLILFQEKKGRAREAAHVSPDTTVSEENVVRQLETELAATRQDLQSHIEQLKSLNEELHSSNEELQAANEELETSREELQSLNEELVTVNSQLQVKIEEQEETNNDLGNFLSSTNIPTVFLDHLLRVKRFTPAMSKLVQLLPTDVGRPISDLSLNNLGPELIADAQTVLESLVPVKKEIKINSTTYVRATLPYRTVDNHIEGVVITYNDVTGLKQVQEKLAQAKDEWERTFDSVPDLIAILDNEHRISRVNKAMAEHLGLEPEQCIGLHCYEAVHGLSAPPVFCPHSRTMSDNQEHMEEVHEDRLGGDFLVTTTPLSDEQGRKIGSVHVAHDITERKRAEEKTRHLASFPQLNPNPVLEADGSGKITFCNPAAYLVLQELGLEKDSCSVFLPPDLHTALADAQQREGNSLYRELVIKDRVFGTTIQMLPQLNTVRIYAFDITLRKRAEQALQESEQQVKLKLNSILSPEGDIGALELSDIIDSAAIQLLMDEFFALTHIPLAIIDLKGKVLVGAGWQEICTKFHRVHPETCGYCIESDTLLTAGMPAGEYKVYKCKNNMWDVATPIEVGGKHMGHFFTGQFLFDDESPDYEFFRQQAKQYGFVESEYLTALDKVPRLSRAAVDTVMRFFMKLSDMISQLSYGNIKLARILAERDMLTESLRKSQEDLARAQEVGQIGSWRLDVKHNVLTWSDENHRIFGLPKGTPMSYETFLGTIHPDDREYVDRKWTAALAGEPYDIEHRIYADGRVKWVREKAYLEFDKDGSLLGGFGITQDITERRHSEEALRTNNDELERLNRALVGRELRMIELKKEVNALCAKTGEQLRYRVDFGKE